MYIHIYNDSVKRCIYVCIVYVCIYVCMRVCLHVYSHVFVLLASIHIRLPQTYTHTHTHTRSHRQPTLHSERRLHLQTVCVMRRSRAGFLKGAEGGWQDGAFCAQCCYALWWQPPSASPGDQILCPAATVSVVPAMPRCMRPILACNMHHNYDAADTRVQ